MCRGELHGRTGAVSHAIGYTECIGYGGAVRHLGYSIAERIGEGHGLVRERLTARRYGEHGTSVPVEDPAFMVMRARNLGRRDLSHLADQQGVRRGEAVVGAYHYRIANAVSSDGRTACNGCDRGITG